MTGILALCGIILAIWVIVRETGPARRARRSKPTAPVSELARDVSRMAGVWGEDGLWNELRCPKKVEDIAREMPTIAENFRAAMAGYTKLWVRCHATVVDPPPATGGVARTQTQPSAVAEPRALTPATAEAPARTRIHLRGLPARRLGGIGLR